MINQCPLRVDFAGGWLDVPKFAIPGAFIVNCAISPLVSLTNWPYECGSGLGGSAAYSLLMGNNSIQSELDMGVGWQDPAIIKETGLCVWQSGPLPAIEIKKNPDFLQGKMGLLWTGKNHHTPSNTDRERDYILIKQAGDLARLGVQNSNLYKIGQAVDMSYSAQLDEGMEPLPNLEHSIAKKYCGGGWGGYALYLFEKRDNTNILPIEPFINDLPEYV